MREVVAATDMVEVVNGRTSLRRAGSHWTGRCPFHEERTPSFSVNPLEKLFYCFGCGKGGDAITFVRETEALDFVEAVEWLAERFRVTLEYEEISPALEASRKRRDRLHALLEQATSFYERHLWDSPAGEPVREYLVGRELHEPICREFRLGLSPGEGLARKALEKGFTREELRAAGLTNAADRDYFPPRLMFPLADARGRIVGFQARKLHDDDPMRGKYVNTPETELFHKSAVLYGLHLGANRDREAGARGRRRGEHRRDRAAPGRVRAGDRLDGNRAHRAPAQGVAAADPPRLSLLRRRRGGRGGDASRDGARDDPRPGRPRGRSAQGAGSGRRARGLRGAARRSRELCGLSRSARAGAGGRHAGGVRARARDARANRGFARVAGGPADRREPAQPPEPDACRVSCRREECAR